jgi:hypothetical protein
MMRLRIVLLSFALLASAMHASAGELGINVYGLSYHFERDRARTIGTDNEFNPGLGLRYNIGENERFRWFADGGFYHDSGRNIAKYGGVGAQWKATQAIGVGAALVAFHSDTYNRGRAFITPLPVVSYDFGPASVSLVYMPRVKTLNEINTVGLWLTLWPGRF